jgi:transposase-like protein
MPEETKTICPFCQSSLTVRLGNETHCNSCARSFALDKNPVATQAANRKTAASASTGFARHQHVNEGLEAIEADYNLAEAALREASRALLSCRGPAAEVSRLRQIETLARAKRDEVLTIRGELLRS